MSVNSDTQASATLSIALIGPDEERRSAVAAALAKCQGVAIHQFSSYPADLDDLPEPFEENIDVVLVDLDSNPDYAFEVVNSISANGALTVMVYSSQLDLDLAIRFMRAGAREFLTLPLVPADLAGALARVSVRRPEARPPKATAKKLFVFLGSKGGCGTTTLASNFAVSLALESDKKTLLIDLGMPLGDVAINLGIAPEYSTDHVFQDPSRLDSSFLSSLLAKHSSGLFVLAAPTDIPQHQPPAEAITKLVAVARQKFEYVVVDAGSRLDLFDSALFEESSTIYLVAQVGISELRNANRLISRHFGARGHRLQIILNRYLPHALLFDERHITKALTRPAQWRIPDDYATARRTQATAIPLALDDSTIAIAIRQMARTACGLPAVEEKKRSFAFFR